MTPGCEHHKRVIQPDSLKNGVVVRTEYPSLILRGSYSRNSEYSPSMRKGAARLMPMNGIRTIASVPVAAITLSKTVTHDSRPTHGFVSCHDSIEQQHVMVKICSRNHNSLMLESLNCRIRLNQRVLPQLTIIATSVIVSRGAIERVLRSSSDARL